MRRRLLRLKRGGIEGQKEWEHLDSRELRQRAREHIRLADLLGKYELFIHPNTRAFLRGIAEEKEVDKVAHALHQALYGPQMHEVREKGLELLSFAFLKDADTGRLPTNSALASYLLANKERVKSSAKVVAFKMVEEERQVLLSSFEVFMSYLLPLGLPKLTTVVELSPDHSQLLYKAFHNLYTDALAYLSALEASLEQVEGFFRQEPA